MCSVRNFSFGAEGVSFQLPRRSQFFAQVNDLHRNLENLQFAMLAAAGKTLMNLRGGLLLS
jgi:hypothetical protein